MRNHTELDIDHPIQRQAQNLFKTSIHRRNKTALERQIGKALCLAKAGGIESESVMNRKDEHSSCVVPEIRVTEGWKGEARNKRSREQPGPQNPGKRLRWCRGEPREGVERGGQPKDSNSALNTPTKTNPGTPSTTAQQSLPKPDPVPTPTEQRRQKPTLKFPSRDIREAGKKQNPQNPVKFKTLEISEKPEETHAEKKLSHIKKKKVQKKKKQIMLHTHKQRDIRNMLRKSNPEEGTARKTGKMETLRDIQE